MQQVVKRTAEEGLTALTVAPSGCSIKPSQEFVITRRAELPDGMSSVLRFKLSDRSL